jgi:hypothetical protein
MPAGRKPKYQSAEKFGNDIIAYFHNCDDAHQMPNKAGLCVWLKQRYRLVDVGLSNFRELEGTTAQPLLFE